jgi:hypothetical protein
MNTKTVVVEVTVVGCGPVDSGMLLRDILKLYGVRSVVEMNSNVTFPTCQTYGVDESTRITRPGGLR